MTGVRNTRCLQERSQPTGTFSCARAWERYSSGAIGTPKWCHSCIPAGATLAPLRRGRPALDTRAILRCVNLRDLRIARGWSLEDVSIAVAYDEGYLYRIEHGQRRASPALRMALRRLYGLSASQARLVPELTPPSRLVAVEDEA